MSGHAKKGHDAYMYNNAPSCQRLRCQIELGLMIMFMGRVTSLPISFISVPQLT
jgi:hypothetical protein